MNGEELTTMQDALNQQMLTTAFVPIMGIIVTVLIFYFSYKFYRNDAKMSFKEKISFLKKLINFVLIVMGIAVFISVLGMLVVGSGFLMMGIGLVGLLFTVTLLAMIGSVVYLYYLIYKQYKVLMNNFEQEIIFEDENVTAFKTISKVMMWILFLDLAYALIGYIASFIPIVIVMNGGYFDDMATIPNISVELNTSIFAYFIVCVVFNVFSVIFEKAVEIHKEKQMLSKKLASTDNNDETLSYATQENHHQTE